LSIEKLANLLVLVLLVEMMVTAGLGVSLSELVEVVRNAPLLFRAGLANYVLIPAIAILLIHISSQAHGGAGWIVGGRVTAIRRAVGMTTTARNIGVALVIATASFPESATVTAVILFAIFQTIGLLAIALGTGRSRLTPQAAFSDGEIQ